VRRWLRVWIVRTDDGMLGGRVSSPADLAEIIEEAPAPGLSAELKKDLAEKAVAAAKAVN